MINEQISSANADLDLARAGAPTGSSTPHDLPDHSARARFDYELTPTRPGLSAKPVDSAWAMGEGSPGADLRRRGRGSTSATAPKQNELG